MTRPHHTPAVHPNRNALSKRRALSLSLHLVVVAWKPHRQMELPKSVYTSTANFNDKDDVATLRKRPLTARAPHNFPKHGDEIGDRCCRGLAVLVAKAVDCKEDAARTMRVCKVVQRRAPIAFYKSTWTVNIPATVMKSDHIRSRGGGSGDPRAKACYSAAHQRSRVLDTRVVSRCP